MEHYGRVLIVEDEEIWQDILREILKENGFSVTIAGDYDEAAQALKQAADEGPPFRVATIDIGLPGPLAEGEIGKGVSVLDLIANHYEDVKRVMVSAQELSHEQMTKFFPYDVKDFIIKDKFHEDVFAELMTKLCKELPGAQAVQRQMRNLVKREKPWAVVYVSIDDLHLFKKAYGLNSAEQMLKYVSGILRDALCEVNRADDFIGQTAVGDFLIVTVPEKVEELVSEITERYVEDKIIRFYAAKDIELGHLTIPDGTGGEKQEPLRLMKLAIGIVTDKDRDKGLIETFWDIPKLLEDRKTRKE